MRTAYIKVWRDLWNNKGRTLLVVLSVGVGVFAVGMINAMRTIMADSMYVSHQDFTPAHITIGIRSLSEAPGRSRSRNPTQSQITVGSTSAIDDDLLFSLGRLVGAEGVDGIISTGVRWKLDLDDPWETAALITRSDYYNPIYDHLELYQGNWPERYTLAVEHNSVSGFGIPAEGTIYLELNNRPQAVQIGGVVRDPGQYPPPFGNRPAFYATREMAARITGSYNYNVIKFQLPEYDEARAEAAAEQIEERLEQVGLGASVPFIQDPQRHTLQDILDGVLLILGVMAVLSLGLSVVLVVNTMQALIVQQVPQIGIMKTVGALTPQVVQLYLSGVMIYGALSLMIAVPLGAVAANFSARQLLHLINVPPPDVAILSDALTYQLGTGLLVPLLAALWPVIQGASITVAAAINPFGSSGYGNRFVDRLLGRIRRLPRFALLSLRNAFRQLGRTALTEITLIAAGAVFLMVMTANFSFQNTIDDVLNLFGYDVVLGFSQPQRIEEVEPVIANFPNVAIAEMWVFHNGLIRLPEVAEGTVGQEFELRIRGIPRDTQMFTPDLWAGRELLPEDGRALILNRDLAEELGVGVGDVVLVDLEGSTESTWTIVGLIFDMSGGQRSAYAHRDTLLNVMRRTGEATVAEIQASTRDPAAHEQIEQGLRDFFEARGVSIGFSETRIAEREQIFSQFNILIVLLLTMAFIIASVGGIGLAGTLSINVLERRREIGVMRAVGASSGDVALIFMGEGLLLGVFSWLLAIPLSIPLADWFVDALSLVVDFPLQFHYSWQGVGLWLVIVVVLSLGASFAPARRATQISVRESLSYE